MRSLRRRSAVRRRSPLSRSPAHSLPGVCGGERRRPLSGLSCPGTRPQRSAAGCPTRGCASERGSAQPAVGRSASAEGPAHYATPDRECALHGLGLKTRIAGEVKGFDPANHMDGKAARRMDAFAQYGVAAALEAVGHARLVITDHNRDRIGVIFATGAGGLTTIIEQEHIRLNKGAGRVSPFAVPALMPNAAAGQIGLHLGARGMGLATASACASSNDALGIALAAIRLGWADCVIAGGTEAVIVPLALAGFNQAGALS